MLQIQRQNFQGLSLVVGGGNPMFAPLIVVSLITFSLDMYPIGAVALSSNITKRLSGSKTVVRAAFTIFRVANFFPVRNSTRENGRTVVGSSVVSVQVDGIVDGTELDSPVQLLFVLNNAPVPGPNETASRRCAFWDFNAAGKYELS